MNETKQTDAAVNDSPTPLLLVTGFGPFEQYSENPSGDIAEALNGRTVAGVRILGRRIEVRWRGAWESIRDAVQQHKPTGLLCLGVAPGPFIRLEILAKNTAWPCPDVGGEGPQLFEMLRILPDAPAAYWTTLPVDWLGTRLRERHDRLTAENPLGKFVHAERSTDAGGYLCNHVFFHSMHFLGEQVPYRGFVHVPPYPPADDGTGMARQEILDAGVCLVEELARWLGNEIAG